MRPNFPFLSAASNAILKLGGLLKWRMQSLNDARLSLPLTEVMKIVSLTSPLTDTLRLTSSKPRLRHGRRLCSSLSAKSNSKSVHSLLHFVAGSSSSSPNFPNCFSPGESASVFANYLRSYFSVSQQKTQRSRARGYLSELRRATCPEESHSSFCYSFSPLNFFRLPPIYPPPLPLAQTKLPIPC